MRLFRLFNKQYEFVTLAIDQGKSNLGRMAIYRIPGTQEYFTMPVSELKSYIHNQTDKISTEINWKNRLDLYKKRFIGRNDVYANRYFNKKLNRKMYSPAVPFQDGQPIRTQHLPLTDTVLLNHLQNQSKLAIGLYPLNKDKMTKFLAFDIDGHHEDQPWKELTTSLLKICSKYNLQTLVELSQSGKGCHVWLFFKDPVDAKLARKLGDGLLKITQTIDPRLPFTAFDRMFPAQNQIDKGKIGNLIAAPLEGQSLNLGRTGFVDSNWQLYPNQWQKLLDVKTISREKLMNTLEKLQYQTGINDLPEEQIENMFSDKFYINKSIKIIQKDALYIQKSDLSSDEILKFKWLASFSNPEFYKL